MTSDKLVRDLSDRADVLLEEGHSTLDMMKSAFNDLSGLGVMSILATGRLTSQQIEIVKRVIVKSIAVIEKQNPPE